MTKFFTNLLVVFLIMLGIIYLFSTIDKLNVTKQDVSLNELISKIQENKIKKIIVKPDTIAGILEDGNQLVAKKENTISVFETLKYYDVPSTTIQNLNISFVQDLDWGAILTLGSMVILPLGIIIFIFMFLGKGSKQGGPGQIFNFSQANLKQFLPNKDSIKFKDVAGLKEAKEELYEIVEFLKNPKKFTDLGAKIPRGVLLMGPPGTGKTMLARATASESGVPFFYISGAEFVEMFVGVGSSVKKDTPVLIKENGEVKLISIGEFVDKYYRKDEDGKLKLVNGIETLGFSSDRNGFYGSKSENKKFFGSSSWQPVKAVYRHKTNKIYEIQYNGGSIETTADHSVFVRSKNMVIPKKVSELKPGEILVNLPFKVRSSFIPGVGTTHKIKAHIFNDKEAYEIINAGLRLYDDVLELKQYQYEYALANRGIKNQYETGRELGISQTCVKDWQIKGKVPVIINSSVYKNGTLPRIAITEGLMRLFGYYTAEGRTEKYFIQWTFGLHEKDLHRDCIDLIKEIFNINPHCTEVKECNSYRITIHSVYIAKFFEKYCGTGSHNKHIPEFLWKLPKHYFIEFLRGYSDGDGYITTEKKLCMSSVSKQLILELSWLGSMHGIKSGIGIGMSKAMDIRGNGVITPERKHWTLTIGRTTNPFIEKHLFPSQYKKPIIHKIIEKDYDDYVYDLCGCGNEAFFGGEKPILLHNSRVKSAFAVAKKSAPSILFIDEIDAIGRERGSGIGGGQDEREQTLNQILVEMDGFDKDTQLIICAATNRPDVLDPALLRPGRFDRRIFLDLPDKEERKQILKIHLDNKKFDDKIDLNKVASRTPGFSGADLGNLINEGTILAARRNKKKVEEIDLLESVEKVMMGPEKKSHVINKNEKEITAYHEAGHALLAAILPNANPVHKISILPRGMAGGYTLQLPEEDRSLKTKSEFLDELIVYLGGYATEEKQFGEVSTGSSNDLKVASNSARAYVTKYGMSKLGPISFIGDESVFLGREMATRKICSEDMAARIDEEVNRLILDALKKAEALIAKNFDKIEKVVKVLLEKEILEKDEFYELIK